MRRTEVRRFESAEVVREFEKGRFEVIEVGGLTLGRAIYEPGWRWSADVGGSSGRSVCDVGHVGIVVSGRAAVSFPSGEQYDLTPGDVFHIAPGHDSWVVGDKPYVSLHLAGAETYAA